MDQLGRSGIESFVRIQKCRVRWTDSLVEVKCFHHAIKRKLPLDSAEQNAQVLVELLSLAQVSDLPADELKKRMAHDIVASLKDPFSSYYDAAR